MGAPTPRLLLSCRVSSADPQKAGPGSESGRVPSSNYWQLSKMNGILHTCVSSSGATGKPTLLYPITRVSTALVFNVHTNYLGILFTCRCSFGSKSRVRPEVLHLWQALWGVLLWQVCKPHFSMWISFCSLTAFEAQYTSLHSQSNTPHLSSDSCRANTAQYITCITPLNSLNSYLKQLEINVSILNAGKPVLRGAEQPNPGSANSWRFQSRVCSYTLQSEEGRPPHEDYGKETEISSWREGRRKLHQVVLTSDSDVLELVVPLENCNTELPK